MITGKSLGELTERELHYALWLAARRRDELAAEGKHDLAECLNLVAIGLAAERDSRVELACAINTALAESFGVLGAVVTDVDTR